MQLLDLRGIARHMGVQETTPQQWRQRGILPDTDYPEIRGCPLWNLKTIKTWAYVTGRDFWDIPGDDTTLNEFDDVESPLRSFRPRIPGMEFSATG